MPYGKRGHSHSHPKSTSAAQVGALGSCGSVGHRVLACGSSIHPRAFVSCFSSDSRLRKNSARRKIKKTSFLLRSYQVQQSFSSILECQPRQQRVARDNELLVALATQEARGNLSHRPISLEKEPWRRFLQDEVGRLPACIQTTRAIRARHTRPPTSRGRHR